MYRSPKPKSQISRKMNVEHEIQLLQEEIKRLGKESKLEYTTN